MVPNADFFNARYFMGVLGNFTRPDPGNAGADLYNPQSWNAYAYVLGNPLNGVDPSGACDVFIGEVDMYPGKSATVDRFASNKIGLFPFGGMSRPQGIFWAGVDGGDVSGALLAIRAAISQTPSSEQVNLFTISGGAETANLALGKLSSDELSRIGNITYMIPGSNPFGGNLASGSGTTTYIKGTGLDRVVPSARPADGTYNLIQSACGHDASCVIKAYSQLLNNLSGSSCTTPGVITPNSINVAKGTATSTITYGPVVGGGDIGNGIFFWPTYNSEGDLTGGFFGPISSPARTQLKPY